MAGLGGQRQIVDERLVGLVPERDVVEFDAGRDRSTVGDLRRCGSAICSSASRISKMRSAEATPDCSRLIIEPICVSGWVNWREYWMNACTSPRRQLPEATRSPPTTAIGT